MFELKGSVEKISTQNGEITRQNARILAEQIGQRHLITAMRQRIQDHSAAIEAIVNQRPLDDSILSDLREFLESFRK